jgi:hypothetical protein
MAYWSAYDRVLCSTVMGCGRQPPRAMTRRLGVPLLGVVKDDANGMTHAGSQPADAVA